LPVQFALAHCQSHDDIASPLHALGPPWLGTAASIAWLDRSVDQSIGLPKNGDDGRVGEARRITSAVINVTDNVRGDLSARVITVSELNRQKIARAIECDGHDAESVGTIDTTDIVRRDHSLYLTVAKDISSPQARTKRAISSNAQHDQLDKSDTN
jgi:hypothetical protein